MLDVVIIPELAYKFIFIRLVIVVPVILLILFLTYRKIFENISQLALLSSIFVTGGDIITMIALGGTEVNSAYYPGLILVFIFSFTFFGLKFKWAMLSNWLLVIIYETVSIYSHIPWDVLVNNNYFLISTLFFSMVAGYSIEFYRRNEFFIFHLLELEKEKISTDNVELERMVSKRTEELLEAKEKAENADKMKSIFLAQMSHEIRTPINALVSMSSLLRYDFEEGADEDQLMSFDVIDRAGERIIRTVDLLLNLSEIQAGTYEKDPTQFDVVSDVIAILVAEYKKVAKNKNIKLSFERSQVDTELFADSYTVNQIFTQLIDNAIKFTLAGEVIIKIVRNKSEKLVVEIKDTGVGIEKSYLPELFKPFSQEDMGYSRKFDGNGIGMALVKTYCKLNNAKIEVESKKGVGSTFRVFFS